LHERRGTAAERRWSGRVATLTREDSDVNPVPPNGPASITVIGRSRTGLEPSAHPPPRVDVITADRRSASGAGAIARFGGRTAVAVAGVSHRRTPAEVRERLHLTPDRAAALAQSLAARGSECVVLVTCNRTEVYVSGASAAQARQRGMRALAGVQDGVRLPATAYGYVNAQAAQHLFRVAAGLDSLVLADTQIAAQVRSAYRLASDAGCTGPLLNRLFECAARASKRIRSETTVARGVRSIPGAAMRAAAEMSRSLPRARVLVIGAGGIGEVVASTAVSRGCREVVIANRDVRRGRLVADRVGCRSIPLDELDAYLWKSDVVFTTTAAREVVLSANRMAAALARRPARPLAVLDLALPRDVDPAVGELPGVQLLDLDDLARIVSAHHDDRHADLDRADRIARTEADRYEAWRRGRSRKGAIVALRQNAEDSRRAVLSRHASALSRLPASERDLVETITTQLVAKLLHESTLGLGAT